MGAASKGVSIFLRIAELIASVIPLGILGHFLSIVNGLNVGSDQRVVYGVAVASLGLFFSLVLLPPLRYSFWAFPIDIIMAIMWLVAFCLLETLTGMDTCNSSWYWSYWGFYWGGWWRTPVVVSNPWNVEYAGCAAWRAVLGWSFIAFFLFMCSAILGIYEVTKHRKDKKHPATASQMKETGRNNPPSAMPYVEGPNTANGTQV
jgi:hypothetical protein